MVKLLKELLPKVLPKTESWQIFLLQEWNSIIGDLKIQVRLEKIQKDTLILSVAHASWMQELYCLSDILIKKINAKLDYPHIKKLRFKCSNIHKKKITAKINKKNIPNNEIRFTDAQKKALEIIKDPHLKHCLEKFLMRCCKENY